MSNCSGLAIEELNCVGASVLNADNPEALAGVLGGGGGEALRSDCDEQLLISMPFPSAIKLHSLNIHGGATAPLKVKLFINHDSLGFSDVEDAPGHHEFELTPKEAGGGTVMLPFVKFQFVTNLTVRSEAAWRHIQPPPAPVASRSHASSPPRAPVASRSQAHCMGLPAQIFVASNQADEEVSTIDRIQLFGQSKADTNMKEFKKVG